ncbi:MAG: SIMPL domain-containing protein [Clostridia bacterium]|nr:SIMPL domain-containing protein [Clostridia bacterium]
MKRLMLYALLVLLLLPFAVPALADGVEKTIRVTGNAVVSLAADTATIQIGVNTRKETVREAQAENADLMAAVMDALHQCGIEDKDIITSQFNVSSIYEYGMSSLGRETRTLYYEVQNNVSVTIHDLKMIGAVLDAAVEAGANTTYGIVFSSTQENEAYQKALTRAVEDAMQKAKVLAAAAGVELGDLVLINSTQSQSVYSREAYGVSNVYAMEAKTADAGTSISSGDVTVSAEVMLEYRFQ